MLLSRLIARNSKARETLPLYRLKDKGTACYGATGRSRIRSTLLLLAYCVSAISNLVLAAACFSGCACAPKRAPVSQNFPFFNKDCDIHPSQLAVFVESRPAYSVGRFNRCTSHDRVVPVCSYVVSVSFSGRYSCYWQNFHRDDKWV